MSNRAKPEDIKGWLCRSCVHLRKTARPTCEAFPDGIPFRIISGEVRHTKPYPGDHGIRFEPVDAEAGRIVAEMFNDTDQ